MNSFNRGWGLVVLGILGTLFVLNYDKLMGKPVNNFTGPKSVAGFIFCGLLVLIGVILAIKEKKG